MEMPPRLPRVQVVVPARNEAATIARCVESLLAQDYAGEFPITLVDDHSEDETGARARSAAQSARTGQVSLLEAAPLEPGWTGKLWALQQGIYQAARHFAGLFLVHGCRHCARAGHAATTVRGPNKIGWTWHH